MANLQTVITNYSLDDYRHERITFIYQGTIQIIYVLVIIDIVQLYSLLAVSSMWVLDMAYSLFLQCNVNEIFQCKQWTVTLFSLCESVLFCEIGASFEITKF